MIVVFVCIQKETKPKDKSDESHQKKLKVKKMTPKSKNGANNASRSSSDHKYTEIYDLYTSRLVDRKTWNSKPTTKQTPNKK